MVGHPYVVIPSSNMKVAIARVLKSEGYIRDYEMLRGQPHKTLRVYLLYGDQGEPVIQGIQRASKPGLRAYAGRQQIPRVYGGLGMSIFSTSQGVMTGREASQRGIGGEVLCYVW